MQLARYLRDEDCTLAEFGRLVDNVEESTVARWRDGIAFPSPTNMQKIEAATGGQVTYRDFQAARAAYLAGKPVPIEIASDGDAAAARE